jgi:GDP/UDP-N,N'-diacetylbacillosamine 2-epimerase (hydrolysing)
MKTRKIRIAGITGCRSEYDIIYPVLKGMQGDPFFDVSLVVCGAHLSDRFGYTVSEIEKDSISIADRIHNLIDNDREVSKSKGSGLLMTGLSDSLDRLRPDYAMVVGDREEAVVSAVVCTYLGVPLIHLCGGDRTAPKAGDVDEPIRHATSKMAAIHFTMNEAHRKRLLKMGEEPWRVHNVGNPGLDRFKEIRRVGKGQLLKYFGFTGKEDGKKPLILVIQHVISGEAGNGARQVDNTLKAVTSIGANCIVNYPNSDMGSREIIKVIERYRRLPNVRVTRHIPRDEFVNLLRNIDLLAGNSSMALLEGSFLKIPAINVGERNRDRMNGGNVVFVKDKSSAIGKMARKILSDRKFSKRLKGCKPIYGDGNAARRIVSYLKRLSKTRSELTAKGITY